MSTAADSLSPEHFQITHTNYLNSHRPSLQPSATFCKAPKPHFCMPIYEKKKKKYNVFLDISSVNQNLLFQIQGEQDAQQIFVFK